MEPATAWFVLGFLPSCSELVSSDRGLYELAHDGRGERLFWCESDRAFARLVARFDLRKILDDSAREEREMVFRGTEPDQHPSVQPHRRNAVADRLLAVRYRGVDQGAEPLQRLTLFVREAAEILIDGLRLLDRAGFSFHRQVVV